MSDHSANVGAAFAPARMVNDVDLCVWVADAQPGDQIVYYTGHLSRDRLPRSEGYSDAVRRKISEIGNCAYMLGEENWVHLIQRRAGVGAWEYIAVRRAETPKMKPVYRIIQSLAQGGQKQQAQRRGQKAAAEDGGMFLSTGPPELPVPRAA